MIPTSRAGSPFALTLTGRTIRSVRAPSSFFCCASIISIPARARGLRRSAPRQSCSRRERSLTEKSVGKSTACRVISSLIDPRTSALRGVPREVRDLTAAARNSWLVCFDNLSRLPEELADAACRLATGGGFGGRQLYSDHDEAIF